MEVINIRLKDYFSILLLILMLLISIQSIYAEDNSTAELEGNIMDEDLKETQIEEDIVTEEPSQKTNITIEPVKTEATFQTGNCTFKITDAETGNPIVNKTIKFSVYVPGMVTYTANQQSKTDTNGIAVFQLKEVKKQNPFNNHNLDVGTYNLTITGLDDLNGEMKIPITVKKADVIITPIPYREDKGSSKKFKINVTSRDTGEGMSFIKLSLYIPHSSEKYYTITTSNDGIGEISTSGLGIGEYPVTVTTNDTNLNSAEATSTIIINKINLNVEILSLISEFNSGKTVSLKVSDENAKPVSGITLRTTIDGKDYALKTNDRGEADIATSLNVGTHQMIVSVYSSIYTSTNLVKTFNIKKATGILKASTTIIYYKCGKYMTVKLINSKTKQPMFNSKIHFQVKKSNRVISNYYGTTNRDGIIKFNIDLKPGKYIIIITGNDAKSFSAKKITKKLTIKKIPVKLSVKKSSKKLIIKAVNKKTKKVVSGIKLKVKIDGKSYTGKTGLKGTVTVKLTKGSHKVVVKLANKYYSSKTLKKTVKI